MIRLSHQTQKPYPPPPPLYIFHSLMHHHYYCCNSHTFSATYRNQCLYPLLIASLLHVSAKTGSVLFKLNKVSLPSVGPTSTTPFNYSQEPAAQHFIKLYSLKPTSLVGSTRRPHCFHTLPQHVSPHQVWWWVIPSLTYYTSQFMLSIAFHLCAFFSFLDKWIYIIVYRI